LPTERDFCLAAGLAEEACRGVTVRFRRLLLLADRFMPVTLKGSHINLYVVNVYMCDKRDDTQTNL